MKKPISFRASRENKPSYILGISQSHTASAALLKDGEIIACASEERFTRKKLQPGIPKEAISYCLGFAKIKKEDITQVAVADTSAPVFGKKVSGAKPQTNNIAIETLFNLEEQVEKRIPRSRELLFEIYKQTMKLKSGRLQASRLLNLQKILKLPPEKFVFVNHHLCHASTSLFSSPFPEKNKDALIFTADGVGDFESGTIYRYRSGQFEKLVSIDSQQSLGFFYLHITQLLGLKPIEDEYKVMGLAPYADPQKAQNVYKILRAYFDVNKSQNRWTIKISEFHLSRLLPEILKFKRFDYIAYAAQRILEEILVEWIKNAIDKYQISNIALGGGVFANVKVNQKIANLKKARQVFCMPSPSDESNALGSAYYLYFKTYNQIPKPIKNLYLGPEFTNKEIETSLKMERGKFLIKKPKNINLEAAKLLARNEIVARFNSRMEFGSRALGNRSILSRPDNRTIVQFINSAIKNRDFWMPFAPTILRERSREYLILHRADSKFMNVAFDTTDLGKSHLAAAVHPYDFTARPQILDIETNPEYYDLIKKFRQLTGISALLNTSFNLHGQPIVCSPQDALAVFKKTGLKYLIVENFLIEKK